MSDLDLGLLAEPFAPEDVEWRISRSGPGRNGIWATALAYITARAIQKRLDDVCGITGWRNERPYTIDVGGGNVAIASGLSILLDGEWLTKWDVGEPSNIHAAAGAFSHGQKRSGCQWGIGRYLYHLEEVFVEVSDQKPMAYTKDWNYATLSKKHGETPFYWQTPSLPGWALPKDLDEGITEEEFVSLKKAFKAKFMPTSKSPKKLLEAFTRFSHKYAGEFPVSDRSCWTRDAYKVCVLRMEEVDDLDGGGVSPEVPGFEE